MLPAALLSALLSAAATTSCLVSPATALLATFGWVKITGGVNPHERRTAWGVAAVTTAAAVLVLLPLHARFMYAHIAPYARANAVIDRSTAQAVIVGICQPK